jgi:hypothetical protein
VGGACSVHGGDENCIQNYVGKSDGKRPIRRPRKMVDNIKLNLREIRCGVADLIHLAQDRDRWRAF